MSNKKSSWGADISSHLDKVKEQAASEPLPIQQTTGKTLKKKNVRITVPINLPEDLYHRLNRAVLEIYPPGKQKRNRAVIDALELFLKEKGH